MAGSDRRPGPADTGSAWSLMQDDMAALLRVLGLGDHPRPISPHEVMVNEIIPAVEALVKTVNGFNRVELLLRVLGELRG